MKEVPDCQLKKSKNCTGKAIMVATTPEGKNYFVCHNCNWLLTRGVEYKK